jgi:hypothetical protein
LYEGRTVFDGVLWFFNADRLLDYSATQPERTIFGPSLRIAAAIPSPSTAAVFAVGLAGLSCRARRRSVGR